MKILITGAKGQLGKAFQKKFEQLNIRYIAKGSKELDMTKIDQLRTVVQNEKGITHIINTAAYNHVDKQKKNGKRHTRLTGLA